MTRAEYIQVYSFAKAIAREASTLRQFNDAKYVAQLMEQHVGQLAPEPASSWKKNGAF